MPTKSKIVKKKALKRPVKRKVTKRKVLKKRPLSKKALSKKPALKKKPRLEGNVIGTVTHYFPYVQAAVVKLKAPLLQGDTVKIKGHTTDLTQAVTSMQIDRVDINQAKKGDEIGILVNSRVRQHDIVYKVSEATT